MHLLSVYWLACGQRRGLDWALSGSLHSGHGLHLYGTDVEVASLGLTGAGRRLTGFRNDMQGQLPRPTDIMSLRIDNGERATLEYADIALSPTRYIASWLRQRGWRLPDYRCLTVFHPFQEVLSVWSA